MTQIIHLRCDRCGKDAAHDRQKLSRQTGWANCMVGFATYDFCPSCWKDMLARANVEPAEN
jgi:hypothetical protein